MPDLGTLQIASQTLAHPSLFVTAGHSERRSESLPFLGVTTNSSGFVPLNFANTAGKQGQNSKR